MSSQVSGIGQIAVTVSDVDAALAFYRDILELPFLFRPATNLAFLDAGGVRLMLSTPQGAGSVGGNSVLYFKVGDIEHQFRTLLDRGAVGEREPQATAELSDHTLWLAFLRDPDGNLVGLMEERRR
ncbi:MULTISPECIES: VOC family protein [unclassified Dyella]|uniref:VOC family protein n=1 Tax=unclassified Dyella TaxID=2634549 RepID=UPI000C84BE14|nr:MULTISPECIES: VOC family protein [unclassified Dyella]MDR3445219.1 VOC family protein [Dyella sp.]PMQ07236.1 Metallothiol transferase FosB [Dyella sp. AD56]